LNEPDSQSFAFEAAITFFDTKMEDETVVPVHSGETIGPGLLLKILRDCNLSVDLLETLLRSQ
jgi:hypothetical protein